MTIMRKFEFSLEAKAHASFGQWDRVNSEIDAHYAALARVTGERDVAKQNAQTVCGFLQTKDDRIAMLQQQLAEAKARRRGTRC